MIGRDRPAVVGVVGGSRSDFPILEAAIARAHGARRAVGAAGRVARTARPTSLFRYAEGAAGPRHPGHRRRRRRAPRTCPGMLAAKTALPVIGVPIPTQHLGGIDSLLSIVQMPRGIPVATVAIGNAHERRAAGRADPRRSATPALAARAGGLAGPPDRRRVLDDPSNAEG